MDNHSLILVFAIIQLMGINFYFNNIQRAKTKFQKCKIVLMSVYPLIVIITLIFNPITP